MRSRLLAASIAALLLSATTALAQIEIKVGHVSEVGSHFDRMCNEFARRANAKLGDKAKVQVYPSSQLGSDRDMLQKMKLGQVHFFLPSTIMSSVTPEFGVFDMPYLIRDRKHIERVVKELKDSYFVPAAESKGVLIVGWWENGFRHITNNVRPITKPEDLKGVKLRVPSGEWRIKMFQSYGASPSPMEFNELFTALKTGVMDGQENPLINVWAAKFFEVQKYLSLTGHVYVPAYFVTSPTHFARLPEDVQKILREAAIEVEPIAREIGAKDDSELLAKIKEKGMQVNEADKAAFVAGSKQIYEEFGAKVKGGAELIAKIQSLAN